MVVAETFPAVGCVAAATSVGVTAAAEAGNMSRFGGAEMEESVVVASETEATLAGAGTVTVEPGGEDIE